MKQTITIELDLPHEYEPVAEFRPPKKGEEILYGVGIAGRVDADVPTNCIVLTRKWEWPEWLDARCIWRDNDGGWFAGDHVGHCQLWLTPTMFHTLVTPPDGKPRVNPKYQQEN